MFSHVDGSFKLYGYLTDIRALGIINTDGQKNSVYTAGVVNIVVAVCLSRRQISEKIHADEYYTDNSFINVDLLEMKRCK